MKYILAGDRDISVDILKYMMDQGYKPEALLVTEKSNASHADELIILSGLSSEFIFEGKSFSKAENIEILKSVKADYIFGIHFPYIISKEVLEIPAIGFLNLHPAYLPYNKGWHTPSWAIIEGTRYGATLHFMSEELDKGDIIYQKECIIKIDDTADSLYNRVKKIEIEVFKEAFPDLLSLQPKRIKQNEKGTIHLKKELSEIQKLELGKEMKIKDLLVKLRALTTNRTEEAAYFIEDGKKYYIQLTIIEEK